MKIESLGIQSSRSLTSETGNRVEQAERKTAIADAVTFEREKNKNWQEQHSEKKRKDKDSEDESSSIPQEYEASESSHIDIVA